MQNKFNAGNQPPNGGYNNGYPTQNNGYPQRNH